MPFPPSMMDRRRLLLCAGSALAAPRIARAAALPPSLTNLVILGTEGGPIFDIARKMAGQAVVVDGHAYVVDVGYGVVGRMAEARLDFAKIDGVFFTHAHSDHIADFPMLSYEINQTRPAAAGSIHVVGPSSTRAMTDAAVGLFAEDIAKRRRPPAGQGPDQAAAEAAAPGVARNRFSVTELAAGGVVHTDPRVKVTAAAVNHPPFPSFAYRFDTADRSIVISGDTTPTDSLVDLARGADILVHEAQLISALGTERLNMAAARQAMTAVHTTAEEAGEIAARAGVKLLVLSHLIPGEGRAPDELWRAEAAKHFKGPIVVAKDLMVL